MPTRTQEAWSINEPKKRGDEQKGLGLGLVGQRADQDSPSVLVEAGGRKSAPNEVVQCMLICMMSAHQETCMCAMVIQKDIRPELPMRYSREWW